MSKVTFFGGVGTATGANIMLDHGDGKILVDCGLLQGSEFSEDRNREPFPYDPASVHTLLVTHAHLDHIGKIPKLVRDGFRGKIISTKETRELAEPMLHDELSVMRSKYGEAFFDEADITKALSLWQGEEYGKQIKLADSASMSMQDAGHILGSAIMNVEITPPAPLTIRGGPDKKIKISFTGDLGNSPSPLLPDTEVPKGADYIVMESVYGDRNHQSKEERRERLKAILTEGIKREGDIVMPAFSVERTQVLLYEINNLIEDGEIPQVPVFLDSPLAIKVTEIYKKYSKDFKDSVRREIKAGDDIFDFPGLKIVRNFAESAAIASLEGPKIILAGSGMSEGGRIVNHEMRILDNPKNTLMLVGYQAPGTFGRRLEEGAKEIIPPAPFYDKRKKSKRTHSSQKIKVRATIESLKGYSSHKDSDHLVEFIEKATSPGLRLGLSSTEERQGKQTNHKLKRVFVIMGEPKASLFLSQRIREYLDIEAVYPEEGREYQL